MSGPRAIGPYLVERKLGAGGMGAVFQVVHTSMPGARYALKAYLGGPIDAQQLARFEREIQALGAVRHPNLVHIHAAGHDQGRPYYVMDLVEGEDLQQRLARHGPFPPRDAVKIVRDVTLAVAALHSRGIVHRDIKPANVIQTAAGRALLTDLGVAKILSDQERERLTRSGELVGTPAYMAPEQALGLPEAGAPVDVWALGMLLYTLLAGRPALKPGNALAMLQQVAQGQIIPLLESAPEVPREVAIIVASALRRDAKDRPDAAGFAHLLDGWLRGESPDEELEARGSGRAAALACVVLLALGGGLAWAWTRRPVEPVAERAARLIEDGLAALVSGSAAPLPSGAWVAIEPELADAIGAGGTDARELQARRALLVLLEAEGALRRREPPATVAALLSRLPADGELGREGLDRVRPLRAAVAAGLPDGELDSLSLESATALWPDWPELRARKLRRARDPRGAVGDATRLLELPGVAPALRGEAAEVLVRAQAWKELERHVASLGEPHRSRCLARRALTCLPSDSEQAARILAAGVRLLPDDPVRVPLEGELRRLIDNAKDVQAGPETVARRRAEGWAHLALHHIDSSHRLTRARAEAMTALPFDIGITEKKHFVGPDFDLVTGLAPLFQGEQRGRLYLTLMFAINELWVLLPSERQAAATAICREGYAYCLDYPELLGVAADRLANLLSTLRRPDEIRALVDEAVPRLPENERRVVHSRLLHHQAQALGDIYTVGDDVLGRIMGVLDQALELDPGNHEARATRGTARSVRFSRSRDPAHRAAVLEDLYARLQRPGGPGEDSVRERTEWANDAEHACNLELDARRPDQAIAALSYPLRWRGYGRQALRRLALRLLTEKEVEGLAGEVDAIETRLRQDLQLLKASQAEGDQLDQARDTLAMADLLLAEIPRVRALLGQGSPAVAVRLFQLIEEADAEKLRRGEARRKRRERQQDEKGQ